MARDERNPLFIPKPEEGEAGPRIDGCPACGGEWTGRNVQGVWNFTCKACGNRWQGGLPQVPADPRIPTAPQDPRDIPPVRFVRNSKGEFEELRRHTSTVQPFRTGAPIPEGEE
jgi:hypothetical protein